MQQHGFIVVKSVGETNFCNTFGQASVCLR